MVYIDRPTADIAPVQPVVAADPADNARPPGLPVVYPANGGLETSHAQ